MIHHVEKIWGSEDWLVNNEIYCAKFLNLKQGFQCSLHYHKNKDETFYILKGEVEMDLQDNPEIPIDQIKVKVFKQGEQIRLKPNTPHRFRSLTPTSKILEISTHHEDDDSYRKIPSGKI